VAAAAPPSARHLGVLRQVTAALTASDDLGVILDMIVGGLVAGAEAALARLWLFGCGSECPVCATRGTVGDGERDEPALHLRASAGIHTHVDGAHHRVALGALKMGEIARTRTPIWTNDVESDPRVPDKSWVARHGLRAFAGYPLVFRGELVGALGAFFRRAVAPAELGQLKLLSAQAATAIKNAHLFRQVARFHERELEARYAATLAERTRLAREIHDTLLQGFAGLTLQLQAVADRLARGGDPEAARRSLARVLALADSALVDARRAVWDMRAPELEQGTLAGAVARVARSAAEGTGVRLRVVTAGVPYPVESDAEQMLLRVAREAVVNAVRHGAPARIEVELCYGPLGVRLSVRDDGRGFRVEEVVSTAGGRWGLLGIRERAARAGAELTIATSPGQGTALTVHLPRATARARPGATTRPARRASPPPGG
jgi:signal transduction histidine kinase